MVQTWFWGGAILAAVLFSAPTRAERVSDPEAQVFAAAADQAGGEAAINVAIAYVAQTAPEVRARIQALRVAMRLLEDGDWVEAVRAMSGEVGGAEAFLDMLSNDYEAFLSAETGANGFTMARIALREDYQQHARHALAVLERYDALTLARIGAPAPDVLETEERARLTAWAGVATAASVAANIPSDVDLAIGQDVAIASLVERINEFMHGRADGAFDPDPTIAGVEAVAAPRIRAAELAATACYGEIQTLVRACQGASEKQSRARCAAIAIDTSASCGFPSAP